MATDDQETRLVCDRCGGRVANHCHGPFVDEHGRMRQALLDARDAVLKFHAVPPGDRNAELFCISRLWDVIKRGLGDA